MNRMEQHRIAINKADFGQSMSGPAAIAVIIFGWHIGAYFQSDALVFAAIIGCFVSILWPLGLFALSLLMAVFTGYKVVLYLGHLFESLPWLIFTVFLVSFISLGIYFAGLRYFTDLGYVAPRNQHPPAD